MTAFRALVARNTKLFFRDKGTFFPALLSPLILLFLFVAFLGNVYRDSVRSVAEGVPLSNGAVESVVGGWLVSSLLAVCAVTVAFTANTIMIRDRSEGQADDIFVAPVSRTVVFAAYFVSTYLVTAVICLVALCAGFVYIGIAGWHLSAASVFLTVADVLLLSWFGTALSAVICRFLRTQGAAVAIQATVSAAYGFLCGAYMPLSNMAAGLRNFLMFLPGTYGTGLLHAHLMSGAIGAIQGPPALTGGMMSGFDCTLDFFGYAVPAAVCYLVLLGAALLLTGIFLLSCRAEKRGPRDK